MTFDYLTKRLADLKSIEQYRELCPRTSTGIHLQDRQGRRMINFGGNDYLGLAAERGAPVVSTGSGASALVSGWTEQHQLLADRLARLESTEAAVVFPSGYAACSGVVATLAEQGDVILSDELNHASLIDGCRLSRAETLVYPHRDVEFVRRTMAQRRGQFQRAWIVTDGVFSMDGHLAPLAELCTIGESYDATVVVDEAHGTGVLGEQGGGVCDLLGLRARVPIRIGTLSKAMGSQGGFVAAPHVVIEYLINRCRPLIYSTALAPTAVAAASEAMAIIEHEPDRRRHVHGLARYLRDQLSISADANEAVVPIIPVLLADAAAAIAVSRQLGDQGFFVPAIRPPTVPPGTSRLRISLCAAHSQEMIDDLVAVLRSQIDRKY